MKYCVHCGNELVDEAVVCTKCGCAVDGGIAKKAEPNIQRSANGEILAIVGLVLAVFMPLAGFIISIIQLNAAKREPEATYGSYAKAGVIVSSVILGLELLAVIAYLSIFLIPLFFLAY